MIGIYHEVPTQQKLVEEAPKETFLPGEMVLTLGAFLDEGCPVTVSSIRAWTAKDPILARVKGLILGGWPARDIKLSVS